MNTLIKSTTEVKHEFPAWVDTLPRLWDFLQSSSRGGLDGAAHSLSHTEPRVPTEPGDLLPWALATYPWCPRSPGEFSGRLGPACTRVWVGPTLGGSLVQCPHQGCALSQDPCPSARTGGRLHPPDQPGRAVYLLLRFVTQLSTHSFCPTPHRGKLPCLGK